MSCVLANRTVFNVREVAATVSDPKYNTSIRRTYGERTELDVEATVNSQAVINAYEHNRAQTRWAERRPGIRGFEPPEPRDRSYIDRIIIIE